MAYSGAVQVIQMHSHTSVQSIVALDAGFNYSDSTADDFVLYLPAPLMVYAFGMYVTESFAAGDLTSLTLQTALAPVGTDTLRATLDMDSTDLQSGDGDNALVTSSTGAEDLDAGDVVYAPASSFPFLAPVGVLTVAHTASGGAAEGIPFIIARWQGMDFRGTNVWANAS